MAHPLSGYQFRSVGVHFSLHDHPWMDYCKYDQHSNNCILMFEKHIYKRAHCMLHNYSHFQLNLFRGVDSTVASGNITIGLIRTTERIETGFGVQGDTFYTCTYIYSSCTSLALIAKYSITI